ncbi:MAG: S8 family serine peptidase [Gemmatimonadota bacterium]|nr:S8 family serine peptidase [Gemmatimonadota bacterium]
MRRFPFILGLFAAGVAHAQEPTVSPQLDQLLIRDSAVTVWFFGVRSQPLDSVVEIVERLGGTVRHRSRWLHAVSATIASDAIAGARTQSGFRHLQPVARVRATPEPETTAPAAGPAFVTATLDSVYGPSAMPVRQLNLYPLASRGVRGGGVTIAVFDTGFETEHPAFDSASVAAQFDFVFNDSVVRNEAGDAPTASAHGTEVWSLLAANLPGEIVGLAPDADYLLAKTEDVRSETRIEEDHWVAAIEWADSLGADIVTSSVGYVSFDAGFSYGPGDFNGDIAVTTIAADSAAARGILVVNSAGNGGPAFRSLITPADGDSVLAAGAEDSLGNLVSFSSRGPTADGRLKPDLTGPGLAVYVVNPFAPTGFSRASGTSFSAPLLAGTAALYRELHPQFTAVEVISALRRTATNRERPDSSQGWGRPDGAAAAFFPVGIVVTTPTDSALMSVTPTFDWMTPFVPAVAGPVTYRLTVARDSTLADVVLDSATPATSIVLSTAQPPNAVLWFTITAVGADSVRFRLPVAGPFVIPEWTTLTFPDAPGGITIRELRPQFEWSSPGVSSPPGPFTYDLRVIRADDGGIELDVRDLTEQRYTPPRDLERNTPYRWRVTTRLGSDSVVVESQATFLIIDDSAPSATLLFQNFPNPFPNVASGGATTCIWFDLAQTGSVSLDILDIRGHLVRNLVPGDAFGTPLPAGRYGRPAVGGTGSCDPRLSWDGRARDGSFVPQGIYLIRLKTPDSIFFKRAVYRGPGS